MNAECRILNAEGGQRKVRDLWKESVDEEKEQRLEEKA
jgi:hypothetical protein